MRARFSRRLAGLRGNLGQARTDAKAAAQPAADEKPSDDDAVALAEAFAGATPIARPNRATIRRPRPDPLPRHSQQDEQLALAESLAEPDDDQLLDSGTDDAYAVPGVSRRTLIDLRRGRWVAEASLDLHGLKREEARAAIDRFLADCRDRRLRVVRIIHGRGLGSPGGVSILRLLSRQWLTRREGVLAFCQARQQDGGEGAVQVLLRNSG